MDSLKRPETAISLVNTAALLGASIYFYKKINNLELELNKHSEHLTTTVKKVREMTIYKKHIGALGNAIKEINNLLGNSHREMETLKELVRFQANQITELQKTIGKLDTENKLELKLKENPYLRALAPQMQRMQPNRQQNFNRPINQGFNQPINQQQGFRQPMNHPVNQQQGFGQPMNQQGFGQPLNNPMNQQGFGQTMNQQQGFGQPINQPANPQNPGQFFPGSYQQHPQHQQEQNDMLDFNFNEQGNYNSQYSDEGNIDDEDAAIDAVRRARQQTTDDPFGFL